MSGGRTWVARRPVGQRRRLMRTLSVTALTSVAVPQVSTAQASSPPLREPISVRASHIRQVSVDRYATRWQVDFERTHYDLRCPSTGTTECMVDRPMIDLGEKTARTIGSEAYNDPAWLRVCSDPTGSSCQPPVPWEPKTRQRTDLAGHKLTCSGTYYLEWTLRTLRRAAVSNKLWFIAGSRAGCPQTP